MQMFAGRHYSLRTVMSLSRSRTATEQRCRSAASLNRLRCLREEHSPAQEGFLPGGVEHFPGFQLKRYGRIKWIVRVGLRAAK